MEKLCSQYLEKYKALKYKRDEKSSRCKNEKSLGGIPRFKDALIRFPVIYIVLMTEYAEGLRIPTD